MYDKLVAKVNNIDSSGFVLKTKFDTDKSHLEKRILDTSGLVKKKTDNKKITEIENKIPSISGLVTDAALTAVENKIPDVSSLIKKQIITQKLLRLKRNLLIIIMTSLLAEVFDAWLAWANLVTKTDFDTKLKSLNQKLTQIKQNIYLLKMNWKSYKHFIQFIVEAKVILKKMVDKIIYYFSQCKDILEGLQVLVVVSLFLEI